MNAQQNPQEQTGATEAVAHLASASSDPQKREEQLTSLVAQVAYHEDQASKHTDAAKTARAAIMLLHQRRGATVKLENGLEITWKNPSRSFDKKGFQAAYPPEANEYMYETTTVLDISAIPPKLKDTWMVEGTGDGSIIIK